MTKKYSKMTNEDFDRILSDILQEEGRNLLAIPGVYEVVSEHFNNEVLNRWENEIENKSAIETTPDFWDCECEHHFIHHYTENECPYCGSIREAQPDSRIDEVCENDFLNLATATNSYDARDVKRLKELSSRYSDHCYAYLCEKAKKANSVNS